ncbi:MAG: hypothetical protein GXZ15_01635, partial [Campylobacter sp.]|nr:hypothetical protein [Campylobacter sp.]
YFLILPKFTRDKDSIKKENNKNKNRDKKELTDLVECSKCGTLVDIKDSIISTSGYVCSQCTKRG